MSDRIDYLDKDNHERSILVKILKITSGYIIYEANIHSKLVPMNRVIQVKFGREGYMNEGLR